MPHVVEDRILESTTTIGVGPLALAGAITGFRRFNAVCAIGDTVPYFVEAIDSLGTPTGDFEYGLATYSAANELTRTLVMGSSNAGAAVNFTAGNKNVGIAALGSALVPTGAIIDFACNTPPPGFMEPDGSLKSRAQYPALWKFAQGSGNLSADDASWTEGQFSPGDGATTFRIPDLRGRFRRSWDHGRGIDAGRAIGSSQTDLERGFSTSLWNDTRDPAALGGSKSPGAMIVSSSNMPRTGGTETRPANVAVMTCLKY